MLWEIWVSMWNNLCILLFLIHPLTKWIIFTTLSAKLKVLYLDSNHLTGSIPDKIGQLQSLESLFIQNNELESKIPSELGDLDSLVHFLADDNNLTGEFPMQLLELSRLEKLWLTGNELNGTVTYEACERKEFQLEIKVDCSVPCICCGSCL